jgi:hypothetical protein
MTSSINSNLMSNPLLIFEAISCPHGSPRCQLGTKSMQNPPFHVDCCSDGHWGTILLGWVPVEGDLLSGLKVELSWRFRWSSVSAFRSFWLVLHITFSCKVFCWGIGKNLSPSKLRMFQFGDACVKKPSEVFVFMISGKFANLLLSGEEIAERVQIHKSVCRFRTMETSGI